MNEQKNNIVEQGTITLNKRNICIEHGVAMSNNKKPTTSNKEEQQCQARGATLSNNIIKQEEQHC